MSLRSAISRHAAPLQPEYVRQDAVGTRAVFRFSVPVLRVRDVAVTIAWYQRQLGFVAESFPEHGPLEFAILERDGVQLLVRQEAGTATTRRDGHSGWDLYLWVDGLDLRRLEASFVLTGDVVRPLSAMGTSVAELEVRDPDGYVLCIGGPTSASARPSLSPA